jgi:hypothetical protein
LSPTQRIVADATDCRQPDGLSHTMDCRDGTDCRTRCIVANPTPVDFYR